MTRIVTLLFCLCGVMMELCAMYDDPEVMDSRIGSDEIARECITHILHGKPRYSPEKLEARRIINNISLRIEREGYGGDTHGLSALPESIHRLNLICSSGGRPNVDLIKWVNDRLLIITIDVDEIIITGIL